MNQDIFEVEPSIESVYILERVAQEIFIQCQKAIPCETLGKLLGYRCEWKNQPYAKIVDWVSGDLDKSHVHARFTPQGIRECELFIDERYGKNEERPQEVGLFHSHPFGMEPHFSSTDLDTFLNFPYDKEGNVFILIDPISHYFKVYVIQQEKNKEKCLVQVPWCCYWPRLSQLTL